MTLFLNGKKSRGTRYWPVGVGNQGMEQDDASLWPTVLHDGCCAGGGWQVCSKGTKQLSSNIDSKGWGTHQLVGHSLGADQAACSCFSTKHGHLWPSGLAPCRCLPEPGQWKLGCAC